MPAIAFAALIALLVLFQLGLALGAPWGRFAWGGQHPGTLPKGYRIASACSIPVYVAIALLVLDRAGMLEVFPEAFSRVGTWVVVGYLALGTVMNAISRSRPERYTMTPVALALALLALLIATGGATGRPSRGVVLDNQSGPVFGTTAMNVHRPQCNA